MDSGSSTDYCPDECISSFREFTRNVSGILAIDPTTRAGNYFLQSLFDQHPQVIVCPWVQYTYSYFTTAFGNNETVSTEAVHQHITSVSYFRLVYQEPSPEIVATLSSFGSTVEVPLDRKLVRTTFDTILSRHGPTISRRDAILATFFSYARGIGRDIKDIRYILVTDAISLRFESPRTGFSARVVTQFRSDFPNGVLVDLERDIRASFASCRHQYVNRHGNAFNVHFGTSIQRLVEICTLSLTPDSCVHLYWILYMKSALHRAAELQAQVHPAPILLRNEDINEQFIPTITSFCKQLGITLLDSWGNANYVPTNVGVQWRGKGAYNPLYSVGVRGPLENDPLEQAQNLAGPNSVVTNRWRSKLTWNEVAVLEYIFYDELRDQGYQFLQQPPAEKSLGRYLYALPFPFQGEVPSMRWLKQGFSISVAQGFDRIWHLLVFLPFYLLVRLQLLLAVRPHTENRPQRTSAQVHPLDEAGGAI
jgi:hypothetical protein